MTPTELERKWQPYYAAMSEAARLKPAGTVVWDDCCPIPIAAALAVLPPALHGTSSASELTAIWSWRQNRIVYAFDAELAAALCAQAEDMSDTDVLPAGLLLHLPYPCVYCATDQVADGFAGFFAWIEEDANTRGLELRIQLLTQADAGAASYNTVPLILHLLPDADLGACIADTRAATLKNLSLISPDLRPAVLAGVNSDLLITPLLRAIQLLLYLVSEDADIQAPPKPRAGQRKKSGQARFQSRQISVGVRVGSAFRRARLQEHPAPHVSGAAPSGAHRAPHLRRGHWHRFWTGPRNGQRKLIIRWLSPIAVNSSGRQSADTIIPVRKPKKRK